MNIIEALKEVKLKQKNDDNINRFMVVRHKYIDEDTKPIIVASIWVREGNIPLDSINISSGDLVANDWKILTAYKKDNPGISTDE